MDQIRTVVEAYAAAWQAGDSARLGGLYHDDFTLHYPGRHVLAGVHRGKPAALRVLREVGLRTNRKLLEIVDVMVGARRGAIQAREQWSRDGREATVERVLVYAARDGKLFECWLFDADQEVIDSFLGTA